MIAISALLGLTLLAGGSPQKQDPPDPKKVSNSIKQSLEHRTSAGDWKVSKVSGAKISELIGSAVKNMKGVNGRFEMQYQTSEGRGTHVGVLKVQDATHHRIDGIILTSVPVTMVIAADGKSRLIRRGDKILKPLPLKQKLDATQLRPEDYPKFFTIDFPRMMFQGLTDGVDSWKPLFTNLQQGRLGYNLKVMERSSKVDGKAYLSYRISGQRQPGAVKTLGPAKYEFVIDGKRFLPVSVSVDWQDASKKQWIVRWVAGYNFNSKFTPKDFTLSY